MKIPLMYLIIHKRLEEKSFKKEYLDLKKVFKLLGDVYHIKKNFRYPVLKEMENFKLIEKFGSNKLIILKNGFNLNNTSKVYRSVGLY